MTNTSEINTEHWCYVNRHKTFKVILLVAILSVFVLGLHVQTGGFKVTNLTVRLETVGKNDDSVMKKNKSRPSNITVDLSNITVSNITVSNQTHESQHRSKTGIISDIRKLRILCLIMTMEKDLPTKVDAVNKTWVKRCHRHFYVINSDQTREDFLNINIPDRRNLLIQKMKRAFELIYERYINDFDYVLKADDDTYVIIENLQLLLYNYPANEPGYLGFHFNKFVKTGYMSGGAGYVITNSGLRHLIERGYRKGLCRVVDRPEDKENSEDIETGRCLETAGVPRLSSVDLEGKETFHPYTLHQHMFNSVPGYVFSWAKNKVGRGKDCCSRYSISFHYMTPDAMLYIDHILYDTTVFGVTGSERSHDNIFKIGKVD